MVFYHEKYGLFRCNFFHSTNPWIRPLRKPERLIIFLMLSPGADVRRRCNTAKRRTCWASEDAENRIIQTSAEIHASPGVCLLILSFCPIWTPFFEPHMDIFTGFVPIPIQKMRNKIHFTTQKHPFNTKNH